MDDSLQIKQEFAIDVRRILRLYTKAYDSQIVGEVLKAVPRLHISKSSNYFYFKIAAHYLFAQYDFYCTVDHKKYPSFESYINDRAINAAISSEIGCINDAFEEFIQKSHVVKKNLLDDELFDELIILYVKRVVFKLDHDKKNSRSLLKLYDRILGHNNIDENTSSALRVFIFDFIIMLSDFDKQLMLIFIYQNFFNFDEKRIAKELKITAADVKNGKQHIKRWWLYKTCYTGFRFIPGLNDDLKKGFISRINTDDTEASIFQKLKLFFEKLVPGDTDMHSIRKDSIAILKDFITICENKTKTKSSILSFIFYYIFDLDFNAIHGYLPDKKITTKINEKWTVYVDYMLILHAIYFSDEQKADVYVSLDEEHDDLNYLKFINTVYDFKELNLWIIKNLFSDEGAKKEYRQKLECSNNKNTAILDWIPARDNDKKNFYKLLPGENLRQYYYISDYDLRRQIFYTLRYITSVEFPGISSFWYLASNFFSDTFVKKHKSAVKGAKTVTITYDSLKEEFKFSDSIIAGEHIRFLDAIAGDIFNENN